VIQQGQGQQQLSNNTLVSPAGHVRKKTRRVGVLAAALEPQQQQESEPEPEPKLLQEPQPALAEGPGPEDSYSLRPRRVRRNWRELGA